MPRLIVPDLNPFKISKVALHFRLDGRFKHTSLLGAQNNRYAMEYINYYYNSLFFNKDFGLVYFKSHYFINRN